MEIRTLIEDWASAVHGGDLDCVLADHEDIVMFDVPPPYDGVRGLDAYRGIWPPFFEWPTQGGSFDIEWLDITAGTDVAFAQALLRCGRTAAGPSRTSTTRSRVSRSTQPPNNSWNGPPVVRTQGFGLTRPWRGRGRGRTGSGGRG